MRLLRVLPVLLFLATPVLAQGAFLGVSLGPSDTGNGALILGVEARSAAHFLGLKSGDLIVEFDRQDVASAEHLAALVGVRLPGQVVDLTVRRGEETLALAGLLGRRAQIVDFTIDEPPMFEFSELEWPIPSMAIPEPVWNIPHLEFTEPQWMIPHFELTEFEFVVPPLSLPAAQGETTVRICYPESTTPDERRRLLDEAVKKYGEGVDVRFERDATVIELRSTLRREISISVPDTTSATKPAPAGGKEF